MDQEEYLELQLSYPAGSVIELRYMDGEPFMPAGLRGIVQGIGSNGQILMQWENGSTLSLRESSDSFFIVESEEKKAVSIEKLLQTYEAAFISEDENLIYETIDRLRNAGMSTDKIRKKNDELLQKKRARKIELGLSDDDENMIGILDHLQEILHPELEETEKNISVILVRPMEEPKVIKIKDTMHDKEELVGGEISAIYPFDPNVAIIANLNAKMYGADLNRSIFDPVSGKLLDIISGDFFIACADPVTESLMDLTEEMQEKYLKLFAEPERFQWENGRLVPHKVYVD